MTVHPYLPCGYNADDHDGDEVDGAGTNWPIDPTWTDQCLALAPIIITEEMLGVFDECPDFMPRRPENTHVFGRPDTLMFSSGRYQVYLIDAVNDRYSAKQDYDVFVVLKTEGDHPLGGAISSLNFGNGAETMEIRKP